MIAKVMILSEESYPYARAMGRSMQYANFIRDISEDLSLGRTYLPIDELDQYGLGGLEKDQAEKNIEGFAEFIRFQIRRFSNWNLEAEKGYCYIPGILLVPVKTAAEMYKWTMSEIHNDPLAVFHRKVKPTINMVSEKAFKIYQETNFGEFKGSNRGQNTAARPRST